MVHKTENKGIPNRGASFSSHSPTLRLVLVLLLTLLTTGMKWQSPTAEVPNPLPAARAIPVSIAPKSGLRMGDCITVVAAPVSVRDANTMLKDLKARNVRLVFIWSQQQASKNQRLMKRMEQAGHRVVVLEEGSRQEDLSFHLKADDIPDDQFLSTLFDGCTLLCPAESREKWERLLKITDIVRPQGIRILLPQTEEA